MDDASCITGNFDGKCDYQEMKILQTNKTWSYGSISFTEDHKAFVLHSDSEINLEIVDLHFSNPCKVFF